MVSMITLAEARTALESIRTLRSLSGAPTPEQAAVLARFTGWGPLAPAFEPSASGGWAEIANELDDLFLEHPQDLLAARDIVDTSFYTPKRVIDAVYQLLRAAGFTSGKVLEPGCGSGRFMAAAPADLDLQFTGVELDPTSAAIAQALNPSAQIINSPMEKVALAAGEFDVAIGNVPFSSATVFDPAYPDTSSLHEYFLMRALDAVRVGGYVIAVTSRFTMDARGGLSTLRGMADIVAALRLPSGAFSEDGTEVCTDIVLFRRRAEGSKLQGWDDKANNKIETTYTGYGFKRPQTTSNRLVITEPVAEGREAAPVEVNNYWREHPEHVAGSMRATGNRHNALSVISQNPETDIARALSCVAEQVALLPMTQRLNADPAQDFDDVVLADAEGRKAGSFHLIDGAVHTIVDGVLQPVPRAGAELRALITLRDAAVELVEAESDFSATDASLDGLRGSALAAYNAYVGKYGALNRGNLVEGKVDPDTGQPALSWRRPVMGGFRKDPDYVTVMAMESFDQQTGLAAPAPILLGRVNRAPAPVHRVDTADEAIAVVMGEGRGLDLARVASLLGLDSPQEAIEELGERVYADPARGGSWELDRDYLSGNIRQKLHAALEAAATDPAYERNVAALQNALPAELGPLDIRVSLGAPWIDAKDVVQFAKDTFQLGHASITHTPLVATWEVDSRGHFPASVSLEWGTPDKNPMQLLDCALNGKSPVVFDEHWVDGRTVKVRNAQATIAAEDKLRAINERFSLWVWEDETRSQRICSAYNERFNSHVTRRHDGSYLTFPGMSNHVQLWDHQKNIIDRVISTPRVLCGHPVGSGKTLSMIGSAMTLRRFGLAKKPLITVPKHLLEQIAREAQQAYPTGRFLIAGEEDLKKENRRLFAARCATGDYDLVVMTHQAFTSLPVDPEAEERWIEEQKSELRHCLQGFGQYEQKSKGAKAVARAVRALDARLQALRHNAAKDDQVRFDQLGIDYIAVDEAHYFKRLQISTNADGFSLGHSKRATDLLLKIETLSTRFPDKPIVGLFTGTPWSNTIAETFVWQKYLQPERLNGAGVGMFDAWAANFVRFESRVEVSPDGGSFRIQRRPSVIQNVPELMGMLGEVADILNPDDIGLERPDATYENVAVEATDEQLDFVAELAQRSERMRNQGKQHLDDGRVDNMLLVCTDGRKAALDPMLLGLPGGTPKIRAAAERIHRIYMETKDVTFPGMHAPGALQVAFCDYGTPRPEDTQTYGRLRAELVELGVPAGRIRWIHEAKTAKAREALFAQCRAGEVSVLIGSTETMGTGTNIQQRLVALHHIDAPWRPSDMTQRDGRALRPGNLNEHVDILRYVTVGTFDGFMWQGLERKARFIAQMLDSGSTVREVEDVSESELTYGEVKALAAGNPMLMKHAELQSEVKRLMTMRSMHQRGINAATDRAKSNHRLAQQLFGLADKLGEAEKAVELSNYNGSLSGLLEMIMGASSRGYGADGYWRGLSINVERHQDDYYHRKIQQGPTATLDVKLDYSKLGSLQVRRSKLRNPKTALANLEAAIRLWWEKQPERVPGLRRRAAQLVLEAEQAEQAVADSAFDGAEQLAAAVAELEALESAMAAEAEEPAAELMAA